LIGCECHQKLIVGFLGSIQLSPKYQNIVTTCLVILQDAGDRLIC